MMSAEVGGDCDYITYTQPDHRQPALLATPIAKRAGEMVYLSECTGIVHNVCLQSLCACRVCVLTLTQHSDSLVVGHPSE